MEKDSLKNSSEDLVFSVTKKLNALHGYRLKLKKLKLIQGYFDLEDSISDDIQKAIKHKDPYKILRIEQMNEKDYMDNYARTDAEDSSSQKILNLIDDAKKAIEIAEKYPEQYKENLKRSLGIEKVSKLKKSPPDVVHTLFKVQLGRLYSPKGRRVTTSERRYYQVRRKALQEVLKIHKKNCDKALGVYKEKGVER